MHAETCAYSSSLPCRYLLHVPDHAETRVILALHGYGSNPEVMLRLTVPMAGPGAIVAALQAPFQHYLTPTPGSGEVGYNWGVTKHHQDAIRLHHEMVLTVAGELCRRFGLTANRCVLIGFSQSVGLNYRLIGTHPEAVGGVIGLCGGVPRDWEEDKYLPVATPILHISRDQDEFFPPETVMKFPQRLAKHASDVEFHLLPGGHRFPSKAAPLVQPWLDRVLGPATR